MNEHKAGEKIRAWLCKKGWINHKWDFLGGEWVLPKKAALTKRKCSRCELYQEIMQDHVFGMNYIHKEVSK